MKKFVAFLLLSLFAGTIGCRTQHYLITEVVLAPVEYNPDVYKNYVPVTEFKDKIVFRLTIIGEFQYSASRISLNTGSVCNATSMDFVYDNHLLEETFGMSFDKDFVYAGNSIDAGVDIMHDPTFTGEVEIIEPEYDRGDDFIIIFSDTFSQKASFDGETFCVYFSCKTSDGITLRSQATVKFPAN